MHLPAPEIEQLGQLRVAAGAVSLLASARSAGGTGIAGLQPLFAFLEGDGRNNGYCEHGHDENLDGCFHLVLGFRITEGFDFIYVGNLPD